MSEEESLPPSPLPPFRKSPTANQRRPSEPEELSSTNKFYTYLQTLGSPADPTCPCQTITSEGSISCSLCHGIIPILARNSKQIIFMQAQKESLKLTANTHRQDNFILKQIHENSNKELKQEVVDLHAEIEELKLQLAHAHADLQVLGEKLVDEVEKRAELHHSKETFQDELEDLSRTLFEEANVLVSTEARKSHEYQIMEAKIRKELASVKEQWALDVEQLRELRERIGNETTNGPNDGTFIIDSK